MRWFEPDLSQYLLGYNSGTSDIVGGYMVVEDINRSASELLAVAHNIDRDNLPMGVVDYTVVADDTFQKVGFAEISDIDTLTVTDQTSPAAALPIPDADGNPWVWDVTVPDCMLEGEVRIEVQAIPLQLGIWFALRLDGVIVARTPTCHPPTSLGGGGSPSFTSSMSFAVPVQSGAHRFEVVAFTTIPNPNTSLSFQIGSRAYFWRGCIR